MFNRLTLFFQESKTELKRVNWPTKQETIRLTVIVIGMSVGVSLFLGVLDFVFLSLLKLVI